MKDGDEKHFPPRRRVNSLLIISKSFYEVLPLHHETRMRDLMLTYLQSVPSVYVSQEDGENTIVYEKEVATLPRQESRVVVDETKFLQEIERETEKPKQSSRERRKRFAEQRSRASSVQTVEVGSGEGWEEVSRQGRRHTHHTQHTCREERVLVPRKQFSAQY